jgi:hypothetical protein
MYDPINPGFYHFWSSGVVGLLALSLIYLTSSQSSPTDRDGYISWISIRQFCLLLLLAVWTHIGADVIEHGGLPKVLSGSRGLIKFISGGL